MRVVCWLFTVLIRWWSYVYEAIVVLAVFSIGLPLAVFLLVHKCVALCSLC